MVTAYYNARDSDDDDGDDAGDGELWNKGIRSGDACGVCGGDNSTCSDCLGVPHGAARLDACGVCADPTAAGYTPNPAMHLIFLDRAKEQFLTKPCFFSFAWNVA
jgi:hypothetical protein